MPFTVRASAPVGLDIGTSAVRGAAISSSSSSRSLVGFGQVALPPGAVVGGEVREPAAVSEAIAQLWKRAKFGSRKAYLGIANQRVLVRQVDFPALEEKEFRSSLRYMAADQIPMPVETAQLDFQILEEFTSDAQEHMMRVLLVAAATEMVEAVVESVTAAGIEPLGVDLSPFAVARAVSPVARGEIGLAGSEAVVDIGAGVTSILVHNNGEPRFVREVLIGGDEITEAIATNAHLTYEEAEAVKLDLSRGVGSDDVREILDQRTSLLVEEIRSSFDYYATLADSDPILSVVVTGGGSLTPGLIDKLDDALRIKIQPAAYFADLQTKKSGLTPEQLQQVEPLAGVAVGLAMGAVDR